MSTESSLFHRSNSIQHNPDGAKTDSESSITDEDAALIGTKKAKLTWFVVVLSCVSTIGGFLFGYDTGVVSGALIKLKADFNLSDSDQEWIVGIAVASAALGAMLGGITSNSIGRKPTLIISSAFFTLGSVLLFSATSFHFLLAGRLVLGLGVGLASMVVPPYIAESSPAEYRGTLVTAFGATITSGQFIASVVCGALSEVHEGWRWMLGFAVIPSVAMGTGMFLLPESPRYLIQKGKIKLAESTLQKITGKEDISTELGEISETLFAETEYSSNGFLHMVRTIATTPPVQRAMAIGCALQAFQQLGGINTVMYYSTTMIKMAGVEDDSQAIWLSCIPSFINAAFALVSLAVIEKVARRKLLLTTLMGTILGLCLLGGAYYEISSTTALVSTNTCSTRDVISNCNTCVEHPDCAFCSTDRSSDGRCFIPTATDNCTSTGSYRTDNICYSSNSWTIIVAMVIYIAMFATGIGTLAWTINSEIYPMWVRGYALSLSTMTNWIFNLIIAFTFLDLTKLLTSYGAFWLYAGITAIGWLIFYFKLPETRGVHLEQVEQLFT